MIFGIQPFQPHGFPHFCFPFEKKTCSHRLRGFPMDLRQLKANVISYSTTMNACRGHWQKSLALFDARPAFFGGGFLAGFGGDFMVNFWGFLNG